MFQFFFIIFVCLFVSFSKRKMRKEKKMLGILINELNFHIKEYADVKKNNVQLKTNLCLSLTITQTHPAHTSKCKV